MGNIKHTRNYHSMVVKNLSRMIITLIEKANSIYILQLVDTTFYSGYYGRDLYLTVELRETKGNHINNLHT